MRYIQKNSIKIISAIFAILLLHSIALSKITNGGKGIFNGRNHSFSFSIPTDWMIDDQNGAKQGLRTVFYPACNTWADSPVILYGNSVSKSEIATIKLQTEITIQDYKNRGNYNYKIEKQYSINISSGKTADIFYFSEDQWGNCEAIAYFEETGSINYLVYNARTKETFKKYLKDFYKVIKTYKNMYMPYSSKNKPKDIITL